MFAINDNENSSENKSSISKNGNICFHFKITNGIPYHTYKLKMKTILPNCTPDTSEVNSYVGQEWVHTESYTSGATSGTSYI